VKRKQGYCVIDPRRLRVLQAVAAHGSLAGPAWSLCLTPPAAAVLDALTRAASRQSP
jgi:hypothetical protein